MGRWTSAEPAVVCARVGEGPTTQQTVRIAPQRPAARQRPGFILPPPVPDCAHLLRAESRHYVSSCDAHSIRHSRDTAWREEMSCRSVLRLDGRNQVLRMASPREMCQTSRNGHGDLVEGVAPTD